MIPSAVHAFASSLSAALLQASSGMPDDPARRIVLDTHVLMECFFWKDEKVRVLREALQSGRLTAVLSRETLLELAGVLSRRQFGASEETVCGVLGTVADCAAMVPAETLAGTETTARCRDPEDQKFLVLAVAARAGMLVTRDRLLFRAARKLRPLGIAALRPEECVMQLTA